MAVPKDKVLPVLKAQLKGKGYPTTFIEKAAERYAAKIETEADIDDYVTDKVEDLIEADKEADRRATAAVKKTTTETVNKITGTTETEDEPTDDMGKMMKMMQGLVEKVNTLEAEKTTASLSDRFKNDERLKGINPVLLKGRIPTSKLSDEEFNSLVEETATELKPFITTNTQQQQRRSTDRPVLGNNGAIAADAQGEEKVPDAIKAFTATINKNNSQVKTT